MESWRTTQIHERGACVSDMNVQYGKGQVPHVNSFYKTVANILMLESSNVEGHMTDHIHCQLDPIRPASEVSSWYIIYYIPIPTVNRWHWCIEYIQCFTTRGHNHELRCSIESCGFSVVPVMETCNDEHCSLLFTVGQDYRYPNEF